MTNRVKSCVLCGSHEIDVSWTSDRFVTTTCRSCHRVVAIEFDPPEEPDLRGRIEVVYDPDDGGASDNDS